jgi:hypothetical protein
VTTTSERVGRNEALFREVNDRIREVSESLRAVSGASGVEFVCECSRAECHAAVELELADYERIRAHEDRFLVRVGHMWAPGSERVVEEHEAYWVLAKNGDAAEAAEAVDERL